MSRDQSKSNFWIQTSPSVPGCVGRDLTGEWSSGPSALWDIGVRYRGVHCAEWRVSWWYGSAVQECPLCGVESGLVLWQCGTGVSIVRSGEWLKFVKTISSICEDGIFYL